MRINHLTAIFTVTPSALAFVTFRVIFLCFAFVHCHYFTLLSNYTILYIKNQVLFPKNTPKTQKNFRHNSPMPKILLLSYILLNRILVLSIVKAYTYQLMQSYILSTIILIASAESTLFISSRRAALPYLPFVYQLRCFLASLTAMYSPLFSIIICI